METETNMRAFSAFTGDANLTKLEHLLNLSNDLMQITSSLKKTQMTILRASALNDTFSKNERGASQEELDIVAEIITDQPNAHKAMTDSAELVKHSQNTLSALLHAGMEKMQEFFEQYTGYNQDITKEHEHLFQNTDKTNFVDTYPSFVKNDQGIPVAFEEKTGMQRIDVCQNEYKSYETLFRRITDSFMKHFETVKAEDQADYFIDQVTQIHDNAVSLLMYQSYLLKKLAE